LDLLSGEDELRLALPLNARDRATDSPPV